MNPAPIAMLGMSFGRLLFATTILVLIIWLVGQWDERYAMWLAGLTLLSILLLRPGLADRLAALLKAP